jgi:NAD-dependent SIR2 family protein deacetylase
VDWLGCGGVLKPDVIFFGENVPRDRVAEYFALTETASLLLVLGSSLTVQSGSGLSGEPPRWQSPSRSLTRDDAEATLTLDASLGRR